MATTRCQICGAENNDSDLFCKDCGSSLVSVDAANQQTAAFTPIDTSSTQTTSIAPVAPAADQASYIPVPQQYSYGTVPQQESSRGALLGWIAATLMLVIFAGFAWASIISDAARDRITGIF